MEDMVMTTKKSTKFGDAKINQYGYYQISSSKEGNNGKLLHRLIVEDYYNISLLPWADIHHLDNNSLNNDIENLTIISKSAHLSLHKKGEKHQFYGKKLPKEVKEKIRKSCTIPYARIIKRNIHCSGKQNYAIRKDGKYIKASIYPNKLLNWFTKEYPNEMLHLNRIF